MSIYDRVFGSEHAKSKPWENRTVESIYDTLIVILADDRRVSGKVDGAKALIRLTRATAAGGELDTALRIVAAKMLEVFPKDEEGE